METEKSEDFYSGCPESDIEEEQADEEDPEVIFAIDVNLRKLLDWAKGKLSKSIAFNSSHSNISVRTYFAFWLYHI